MVLFTEPSDNCRRRYMHSTECPSSCIYTLQRTLTAISVRVHLGYNHNNQPLPQWQIHCMLCLVCYVIQLRISCGASGVFWQTYVAGYSWSRVKNTNGLTVHTIMTGLAVPKPTPLYIAVGGTDQSLLFLLLPFPLLLPQRNPTEDPGERCLRPAAKSNISSPILAMVWWIFAWTNSCFLMIWPCRKREANTRQDA